MLVEDVAMSRGSKIVPVRLPEKLYHAIVEAMESANRTRFEEPYVVSTYVRKCLVEKLEHLERSKKKKSSKQEKGGEA